MSSVGFCCSHSTALGGGSDTDAKYGELKNGPRALHVNAGCLNLLRPI